jgi:hypothetical protein
MKIRKCKIHPPGYPGVPDLGSEMADNMQIEDIYNSL